MLPVALRRATHEIELSNDQWRSHMHFNSEAGAAVSFQLFVLDPGRRQLCNNAQVRAQSKLPGVKPSAAK